MKTIEEICAHDVLFDYGSTSKHAVPDDSEIAHVRKLISENHVEGELCMVKTVNCKTHEFRGWWKIMR